MGRELEDLESVDTQVWLNQIHPEERNKIWGDFEKYLEKGENFHLEYRFMEANKSYIWVEEDVVCLKDENGKINRVFGVIKDITERKLA
jgi:PAS domain S-box-containing protein